MLFDSDGSHPVTLSPQTTDDEGASFLPSGTALVFDGQDVHHQHDLYSVTVAGSGLRKLTHSGGTQPAPCPNGTIAYVHRGDIYLLSRNHRTTRRLTHRGGADPNCSPDSRRIAFRRTGSYRNDYDLYIVSDTGRLLRVVRPPDPTSSYREPVFSPGGTKLAYLVDVDEGRDYSTLIFQLNLRTGQVTGGPTVTERSFNGVTTFTTSSAGFDWQPIP